ncbi:MAG: hypothetical protein V8R80_09065, partial [Eubacterium sp.]
FMNGIGYKHPMRLTDIAEELELHESTISRAMRGKYLQCSWGISAELFSDFCGGKIHRQQRG